MNPSASGSRSVSTAFHPSSALIAGCGYVGHRVASHWASRGTRVHAITRSADKAARFCEDKIRPLILNLASPDHWPSLPESDVVLWSVGFDRSSGSTRDAIWIDGLQRLLVAVRSLNHFSRIIYISSTGVYGDGDGQEVNERTPVNPDSEGGKACVTAEQILQNFAVETDHEVLILRLAGIYGPDRLLRRVTELRSQTPIVSAPDEWLNLIHVNDAVRVIDWCAQPENWNCIPFANGATPDRGTKIMNVVASGSVTRRTYYSALAKLVSAPVPVFQSPSDSNPDSPERTLRRRGGNRRVVSLYRSTLGIPFEYDNCEVGLTHAVENSITRH